ncbi:MAG: heparinase II/III family protein [Clostridia bacterium]|nr:heparinase II/III family protein [Clostridia bacterium]
MFSYSYENLKRVAETPKGKAFLEQVEKEYLSTYDGKVIPANNYSLIKLFYKEGNRALFEKQYFDKRRRLSILQVLALKDERYVDALEEIMSAICDEFTWVLPAHNYNAKTQTFDRTFIDLFSSETAFYLSETVYVFGEILSADIKNRVKLCVEDRIIKNFESHWYWWQEAETNWATVCGLGVGLSYLYLFPERYDSVKDKIESYFKNYLKGLDDDGYCYEGLIYWGYGFTFFTLFYDVYVELKERPKFLDSKKVFNIVNYPINTNMDNGVYVPFADGGRRYLDINAYLPCFYSIKKLYGDKINCPIKVDAKNMFADSRALGFRFLLATELESEEITFLEKKSTYFKNAEVLIYKNENYSFAVKCGNNNELHNHNDVGVFQIVKNSKRLISDLGGGEYTKNYFIQSEKYKDDIFVCGSMSHSVPIVDGKFQKNGEDYYGTVLDKGENYFEIDMTGAYEKGDHFVKVRYELYKNGVLVKYTFNGIKDSIVFRFVSDYEPKLCGGKVNIEEMTVTEKSGIIPKFIVREYKPHSRPAFIYNKGKLNAYVIDYTVNDSSGEKQFFFEF